MISRPNQSLAILYYVRFAPEEHDYCPPCPADIERLVVLVKH